MNDGSAISFPFKFNEYGQVSSTNDPRLIWQHRVILTLLTRLGERVLRPNFGSNLLNTLFETEAVAIEMAQRSISIAFNELLDSLELIEVTPKYEADSGSLIITVIYTLPSGDTDSVTLRTSIFNLSLIHI